MTKCANCGFESTDPDDAEYFGQCDICNIYICDDCCLLKHKVQEHKIKHEHEWEVSDIIPEWEQIRYTCELCSEEFMSKTPPVSGD